MFFGRENELASLNELYDKKKFGMSVIYGRRRIGKSTLINLLNKNLNLKTNEISKVLGRGKHTTRHVELYNIYNGFIFKEC